MVCALRQPVEQAGRIGRYLDPLPAGGVIRVSVPDSRPNRAASIRACVESVCAERHDGGLPGHSCLPSLFAQLTRYEPTHWRRRHPKVAVEVETSVLS